MINKIIILIIFLFNISIYPQDIDTCFTQEELIKLSNKIKLIEEKNKNCDTIIRIYETQIIEYEMLNILYEEKIILKNKHIDLLQEQNKLINEKIDLYKLKWYEEPQYVFPLGILVGIIIVKAV